MQSDVVIIGAGIVGLATAYQLLKDNPVRSVTVLEKESTVARHQTGNNSGVIHSGVYYRPGSLKAKNCVEGRRLLLDFVQEHGIKHRKLHKLIVATHEEELPRLHTLYDRGVKNGVQALELLDKTRAKELEPHVAALQALYLPESYILDYKQVAEKIAEEVKRLGGEILFDTKVHAIKEGIVISSQGMFKFQRLINCAGLHADHFTQSQEHRIIPFRGEYYTLAAQAETLVQGLIYPVPDPKFPFLGVHLTPMVHGGVEAGPNAVLALAREGYSWRAISLQETMKTLSYPGFWKMSARHWKVGLFEVARSLSKKRFVKDLQRLMPDLREEDLVSGGAGVRAQAISRRGDLLDDFCIQAEGRGTHVLNAPSPAATSCFSIGKYLASI